MIWLMVNGSLKSSFTNNIIVQDYTADSITVASMGSTASNITISIPSGYSIGAISITKSINAWCPAAVTELGANYVRIGSINLFREALSGSVSIRIVCVKNN